MQYVELGDLTVYKSLLIDKTGVVDLVTADGGPLVAYRDIGPLRRYLVGFSPLLESNWWRQPSLIIFMRNILEETRARHFIGMPQMVTSGNPAKLWNSDPGHRTDTQMKVELPDGSTVQVPVKEGTAEFGATDKVGFYERAVGEWGVNRGEGKEGQMQNLFAVNLLSPAESSIAPKALQVAANSNVQEVTSVARVNREIWRWLAATGAGCSAFGVVGLSSPHRIIAGHIRYNPFTRNFRGIPCPPPNGKH